MELHGGTVEVDSPGLNQGTTFLVLLPAATSHTHDARGHQRELSTSIRAAQADSTPTLGGRRVLVVDDEQESRELLSHVLTHAGADVVSASSAAEAWITLQASAPDVLVSDIEMPGEDGYTLMRRARAVESAAMDRMVAVAVTAHARPKDRLRALQAGYQSHLSKPFEPAELVAVIASLLASEDLQPRVPQA